MKKRFIALSLIVLIVTLGCIAITAVVFHISLSDFVRNSVGEDYMRTVERIAKQADDLFSDEEYNDLTDFYTVCESLEKNGLDEFIITDPTGSVRYSTATGFDRAITSSGEYNEEFLSGESFLGSFRLSGEEFVMLISAKNQAGYRFVGFVSNANFQNRISSYHVFYSVFSAISCFICIISAVVVVLFSRNYYDRILFVPPTRNYIIRVRRNGNIIKANTYFNEHFDIISLNNCIINKRTTLESAAADGKTLILSLKNKNNEPRYLTALVLWKCRSYLIIANDSTDEIANYLVKIDEDTFDSFTGLLSERELYRYWDELGAKGKINNCAIALIHMGSREYYEILAGLNKVKKLVREFASAVKSVLSKYGELFALDNGDLLLLVYERENITEFLRNTHAIVKAIDTPIIFESQLYKGEFKMGIITTQASESRSFNLDNVIYNAKVALRHAIKNDRNVYVLHTDKFTSSNINFSEDGYIEKMIQSGGLLVYFQPQVDAVQNKVIGFEALLRLTGEIKKEISIEELVAIADQFGGMLALSTFVADKAMLFAKKVEKYGATVSINISPAQILQTGFVDNLLNMISTHGIKPTTLNIEIVESTMVYNVNEICNKLQILKNAGVGVHIDDFGVAYSSMIYLKKLPVTALKIDKQFVDDVTEQKDSRALIKSIIELAHAFELEVICEGVEKKEQCDIVVKLGCNIIQGYLYSPAIEESAAEAMIKEMNANV